MPNMLIQKLIIYRNFNRPSVGYLLDGLGKHINWSLQKIGSNKKYATGLTRQKAALFASTDPTEVQIARQALFTSGRKRAMRAITKQLEQKIADPLDQQEIRLVLPILMKNYVDLPERLALAIDIACRLADKGVVPVNSVINIMHQGLPNIERIFADSPEKFALATALSLKLADKGIDPEATLNLSIPLLAETFIDLPERFNQAIELAFRLAEKGIDPDYALQSGMSAIANAFANSPERFDQAMELAFRLAEKGIDPNNALQFGMSTIANAFANSPEKFEQTTKRLEQLAIKLNKKKFSTESCFRTFQSFYLHLDLSDSTVEDLCWTRFEKTMESLTDYNQKQITTLLTSKEELYKAIGQENFNAHFNLYTDIITRRKRLSLTLLEGILEATEQGIIPQNLTPEIARDISCFIDQTHSFSPIVYKVYQSEGAPFLQELKAVSARISRDELGLDDIDAIIKKYEKYDGLEVLYAIIQMSIPLSGASFVSRAEGKNLLQRLIKVGDLRKHVPQALRGRTQELSLDSVEHQLREGEEVDSALLAPIFEGLRTEEKATLPALAKAIETYLKSKQTQEDKEGLRQVLYRYASNQDLLGEKVDRLVSTDYYTLRLLEEIFKDKDCLTTILANAVDQVDRQLLAIDKAPIIKAAGLVKGINKMWSGSGIRDEKLQRLADISRRYQASDLRTKVIADKQLDPQAKSSLEELLLQDNQLLLSKYRLAEEILAKPLSDIQGELAKFEEQVVPGGTKLELRLVKGIPFGLWGLNAGVCIAADLELWNKAAFYLMPMQDKETKVCQGFAHIFETIIEDKKYWTISGINPSTEFSGNVNSEQFYDQLIEQIIAFAQTEGVEISGIYIPTSQIIHSNRSNIQKIIASKNYKTKTIPTVHWSTKPAYPFSEVYVAWEKAA